MSKTELYIRKRPHSQSKRQLFGVFLTLLYTGGWAQHFVVTHIGGSHLFSGVNKDEKIVKVLDVLWSSVCMIFISSGISEVLIYFPFAPCRPFTPCLLLSSSCCSCANRSCSLSAIHAPEPTNTPALHSLLPCWGSALHELHCLLPQVKEENPGSKEEIFGVFFVVFFLFVSSKCTKLTKEHCLLC